MFRIIAFCEDKHLAPFLRACTGLVVGVPEVQPVINAKAKNGKVEANGDGSLDDLFKHFVADNGIREFKAERMKDFCKANGRAPGSSNYYLRELIKHGVIKRAGGKGRGMRYVVK